MAGDRLSRTAPPARRGGRGGRPGRSPAGCEGTARWQGRVRGAAVVRGGRAERGQGGRSPGREPGKREAGGRLAGAFVARRRRTGRRGGAVRRRRGQTGRCRASARSAGASAVPCGDRGACRVAWTGSPGQGKERPCPEGNHQHKNGPHRALTEEATFGGKRYQQDHGETLYRRSVYTFWRRIIGPTPFFDTAAR